MNRTINCICVVYYKYFIRFIKETTTVLGKINLTRAVLCIVYYISMHIIENTCWQCFSQMFFSLFLYKS